MRYHFTPEKITYIMKTKMASVGRNAKEKDTSFIVGGTIVWFRHMENGMVTSQK